ncbi:DPP IV N-terminal domain-containing protein [uncultured Desulfobacter sp.]|uniref:DPP IV N-terminal domain-containing protein n=1 Tax=uncultured Desulfobacter sp. TaxID=240139 RepID=UPI0029F55304|nr:DPP IV N-terminal domain-containing protein [uncultured Desulfobacter sp.]
MKNIYFLICWGIIASFVSVVAHAQSSLVLWNKLGSDSEVSNSMVGDNGTIVGTSYAFEPAMYGDGYVRKAVNKNFLQFPHTVVSDLKERGSLELWINPKVPKPVPYRYGIFGLVGTPYCSYFGVPSCCNINLSWGDTVTGKGIYGSVNFGGAGGVTTPPEPEQFVATPNVPFHVAISWDIDGIEGTEDKVRVYRDGEIVSSTEDSWDPTGTTEYDLILGYGPDSGGYDKFIIDNLIVWNYAKTDFSDRFNEDPTFPFPDGTIAFTGSDSYSDDMDIYIMNGNGSDMRPYIVHQGNDISPSFSPDGEKLAFVSDRSGQWAIYVINTDGTDFYKVPNSEFSCYDEVANNAVNWSPDSQKLVYLATDSTGGLGIINLDGSGQRILTTDGVGDGVYNTVRGVNWGETSDDLIVHMMAFPWQQNIFKYSISTDTWTQMTLDDTPSHAMDAAVSISGQKIVFTRRADASQLYDLYTMENSPGAQSSNLTGLSLQEGAFSPEWINNDEQIIFSYNIKDTQQWQTGIINADGSHFKIIAPSSPPQYAMYPTWTSETVCHVHGDLNGDSAIDNSDFIILRDSLGKCSGDSAYNPDADYDGDGCVSFRDYSTWYREYYLNR